MSPLRLPRSAGPVRLFLFAAQLAAFGPPAVGCSGDATSPQAQFPGTYTLRTINGQALPFVTGQRAAGTTAVTADVLTIQSGGAVTEQSTVQVTPAGGGATSTQTASHAGTWTLSGTTADLQIPGVAHLTGTFSGGNTLTFAEPGATFVYQK